MTDSVPSNFYKETEKGIIKGILLVVIAMFALTAVLDVDIDKYIEWQWWKDVFIEIFEWTMNFYEAYLSGLTEWLTEKVRRVIKIIVNVW